METVKEDMSNFGYMIRRLHPPLYWHEQRCVTVVVYIDDIWCAGKFESLMRLYAVARMQYDFKPHVLALGSQKRSEVARMR